ncbi:MAG: hypothetical protein SGPRY_012157 [Prymnesium sp.]
MQLRKRSSVVVPTAARSIGAATVAGKGSSASRRREATRARELAHRVRVQMEREKGRAGASALGLNQAQYELLKKVFDEWLLPVSSGTFEEYRTKVIQFGYIAMFSASFPLGAIAATAMNIVELRVDAYKFMFSTRRASYEGSDDIGSWRRVIQVVSWISIIINVLIIAYASNGVRDSVVVPFVAKLDTCEAATKVYLALAWFVIIVEHLLLLFKLGILFVLPNKPAWVREKEAREKHEIEEKERLRMRHIELAT